jgi:hypothetical protein
MPPFWKYAKSSRSATFFRAPESPIDFSDAFRFSGLCSITIPSLVDEIEAEVFYNCERLSRVTFETKSELRRIGSLTFSGCSAVESFCIPSSVELIGESCFSGCENISSLSFENPSHLRELVDLPLESVSWVDIPDSVEVLNAQLNWRSERLTFNFGEGSKLDRITICRSSDFRWRSRPAIRVFMQIPAHRLKALRDCGEFGLLAR